MIDSAFVSFCIIEETKAKDLRALCASSLRGVPECPHFATIVMEDKVSICSFMLCNLKPYVLYAL